MREAQYLDEIRVAWSRLRKENAPPKKPKRQRGKGLTGQELLAVIAYAARDAGLVLFRKSPHKTSFYLRAAGSPFKLRISDHKYSGFSKKRHMSVIVDYVVSGPMDSDQAISLGRTLHERYKHRCDQRLKEASAFSNGE